jgi:peptidoglycan L-alanyl-D-glutamate endopeptidase CwlK
MLIDLSRAHPDLRTAIDRVLLAMPIFGYPMLVFECERTLERQRALYAQGRTAPGHKVTKRDGLKTTSMHQLQPDGYAHAADMVFLVDGKPCWADTLPWGLYGAMVQACGLRWGGGFGSMPDSPHMEVPLRT